MVVPIVTFVDLLKDELWHLKVLSPLPQSHWSAADTSSSQTTAKQDDLELCHPSWTLACTALARPCLLVEPPAQRFPKDHRWNSPWRGCFLWWGVCLGWQSWIWSGQTKCTIVLPMLYLRGVNLDPGLILLLPFPSWVWLPAQLDCCYSTSLNSPLTDNFQNVTQQLCLFLKADCIKTVISVDIVQYWFDCYNIKQVPVVFSTSSEGIASTAQWWGSTK